MLPPSIIGPRHDRAEPMRFYRDHVERTARRHAAAHAHAKRRYYVLDVSHDIKRTDLSVFINQGHTLVDVIEATKELNLQMSGWQIDGDVVHIYNYWNMLHGPESLILSELSLPDNPIYVRFDNYMLAEVKNILTPISMDVGVPITDEDRAAGIRYVYARVTLTVRPNDFAELLARLESSLPAFALRNGWRLGDTYLGLTGDASTLLQTWAVPDVIAPQVPQRLASAPWAPLLQTAPACAILDPTPSCPLLGDRPRFGRTIVPNAQAAAPAPQPTAAPGRAAAAQPGGRAPALHTITTRTNENPPPGKTAKKPAQKAAKPARSKDKRKKGSRHA